MLWILGDLFEAWIGDDAAGAFEREIAAIMARCRASGTDIRFLHGNRDFLLGDCFCARAGMTRIEQPVKINLHGMPTLLLHGDILCTNDRQYQRYRQRITDPAWQKRMLSRPAWVRRSIAHALRLASRLRNRNADLPRMDVADQAVEQLFRKTGVTRMIHGHTHRPAIHRHEVDGRQCERIVLGDWYSQGSLLRASSDNLELESLPRPGAFRIQR